MPLWGSVGPYCRRPQDLLIRFLPALPLLGVARLAEIIERDWEPNLLALSLAGYANQTKAELLAAGRLIVVPLTRAWGIFRCLSPCRCSIL